MYVRTIKSRCGECGQRAGTSAPGRDHKFSCGLLWDSSSWHPLPKRNPGLAIRQPKRAAWPETLHAKRNRQYRHPRSA